MVFEFVFEARRHVERFLGALRSSAPVHLLTLWAPIEVVAAREAARAEREDLGDRVAACWRTMAANLHELGAIIDARAPVEQVVDAAHRRLQADDGLLAASAA